MIWGAHPGLSLCISMHHCKNKRITLNQLGLATGVAVLMSKNVHTRRSITLFDHSCYSLRGSYLYHYTSL